MAGRTDAADVSGDEPVAAPTPEQSAQILADLGKVFNAMPLQHQVYAANLFLMLMECMQGDNCAAVVTKTDSAIRILGVNAERPETMALVGVANDVMYDEATVGVSEFAQKVMH